MFHPRKRLQIGQTAPTGSGAGFPPARVGALMLLFVLAAVFTMPQTADAKITVKTVDAERVIEGQGILPRSEITEAFFISIDETDTTNPERGIPDDGGANLRSLSLSFMDRSGASLADSEMYKFGEVFIYRRLVRAWTEEDWDEANFSRASAIKVVEVTENPVFVDMSDLGGLAQILNGEVDFVVAFTSSSRLPNNDKFSIRIHDIVLVHDAGQDPRPDAEGITEVITCVDSAGDLMPEADYIRSDGIEREFVYYPPNYSDFGGLKHLDALNLLQDLEIPQLLPSESTPTAVIGMEMATRRDRLRRVFLNFTSSIDGANGDNDFWVDDPVAANDRFHRIGVYDPLFDEIIVDVDRNGIFSPADIVAFPGANGRVDTQVFGGDDDLDGLIDEEIDNGVNDDLDYYNDEVNPGVYDPGQDEHYFDYDKDGLYSDGTVLDTRLDTDGTATTGAGITPDTISLGTALLPFSATDNVTFTTRDGNTFDETIDIVIYDEDGDGFYTLQPDLFVDADGTQSNRVGDRNIDSGVPASFFVQSDAVATDSLTNPLFVWRDFDGDSTFTNLDDPIVGKLRSGQTVSGVLVSDATQNLWSYYDQNNNLRYDDGEDIWINIESEGVFTARPDGVILSLSGATPVSREVLRSFSEVDYLSFNDVNFNRRYDNSEDIIKENPNVIGYTFNENTPEGNFEGITPGFALQPGDAFDAAFALIDEDLDRPFTLNPLVDEDLKDYYAWVDENNNRIFNIAYTDVDGDGDFHLNEDLNGNGLFEMDEEDLDGDGQWDQGYTATGDEIYFDYNGNGRYDYRVGHPQSGVDVFECVFPGTDGVISLTDGQPYTNWFSLDEDGDGEEGSPLSPALRWMPGLEGYRSGIKMADGLDNDGDGEFGSPVDPISGLKMADGLDNDGDGEFGSPIDPVSGLKMADGIDNDGDGLVDENIDEGIDEGINEDMGDFAFSPLTPWIGDGTTGGFALGDLDGLYIFEDNGDGVFDPSTDTAITRNDSEQVDWTWFMEPLDPFVDPDPITGNPDILKVSMLYPKPPLYTAMIQVEDVNGQAVPRTDGANYDFYVVVTSDGDDWGDTNENVARFDATGLRYGDDFMVSLARQGIHMDKGIDTGTIPPDTSIPNQAELTKPIIGMLYIGDIIGFVPGSAQGEHFEGGGTGGTLPFIGNPYLDATSSQIGVLGINAADAPTGDPATDKLQQIRVHFQNLVYDAYNDATPEGTFDIEVQDGFQNVTEATPVYVTDLMRLADDSTGGVGLYLDNPDAGVQGVYDELDIPVPLRNTKEAPLTFRMEDNGDIYVDLNPISGLEVPGDDETPVNRGFDYFITVRTSENIDYRDTFKVWIDDGDVLFRSGNSVENTRKETDPISANVPVFYNDLTFEGQTIVAESEKVPVAGLNLYDRNATNNGAPAKLEYVQIRFINVGDDSDFTNADLMPLTLDENSGVALYRDSPSTVPNSKPGVFDDTDQLVRVSNSSLRWGGLLGFPNTVKLFLDPYGEDINEPGEMETIPADDLGENEGDDYFVVIRTSRALSNGDDFIVSIQPIAAGGNVEWPLHFSPLEKNGAFNYTYSYEHYRSEAITANTQTNSVFVLFGGATQTRWIEADSDPVAMLGINVNSSGGPERSIVQLKMDIVPDSPGFERTDLTDFSLTENSGIALWKDNDEDDPTGSGFFTYGLDDFVQLTESFFDPVFDATGDLERVEVTMNLSPAVAIPADDDGSNIGADFFVTLRTSRLISFMNSFHIEVPEDAIRFESGTFGNDPAETGALVSNVPIFLTDLTNFFDRQVGRNYGPMEAIGINARSGNETNPGSNATLNEVYLRFYKEGDTSTFTNADIAELLQSGGGVQIWVDNPAHAASNGIFDATNDIPVTLDMAPEWGGDNQLVLRMKNSPLAIPADDDESGTNYGDDFFITFTTSNSLTNRSRFSIALEKVVYGHGSSTKTIRTQPIVGSQFNQPPSIELHGPVTGDRQNRSYTIEWSDFDPEGNAFIRLYYVSKAEYDAGLSFSEMTKQTIALDIPEEDETDAYVWDVSRIGSGKWYVAAQIRDERSQFVDFSPGYLTTANQPPTFVFSQPDGIDDAVVQGEPYSLAWIDTDFENNAIIDLYLDRDGQLNADSEYDYTVALGLSEDPDNAADAYALNTSLYEGGLYYAVAVVDDEVNPPLVVRSPGQLEIIANHAPDIRILQPALGAHTQVVDGDTYEILYEYLDDDSAAIQLFWDGNDSLGGEVLIASATGQASPRNATAYIQSRYLWNIASASQGKYYVKGTITDGVNGMDYDYGDDFIWINKRPSFDLTTSSGQTKTRGDVLDITWTASDPDSNAKIRLELQPSSGPRVTLANNLMEDSSTRNFSLDTADLAAGTYTVYGRIDDRIDPTDDGSGTVIEDNFTFTLNPNQSPTLSIVRPGQQDVGSIISSPTFEIRWIDNDDSEATLVTLFSIKDGTGEPTFLAGEYRNAVSGDVFYATGIPARIDNATPEDSFIWELGAVPAGTYHILCRIDDGVNAPVEVPSTAAIVVNKQPRFEFTTPDPAQPLVRGDDLTVRWDAGDPDNDAKIDLRLVSQSTNELLKTFPKGSTATSYTVQTKAFPEGDYTIRGIMSDGVNPAVTDEIHFTLDANLAPSITMLRPDETDTQIVTGDTFQVRWTDTDPEDKATVTLFMDTNYVGLDGTIIDGEYMVSESEIYSATGIPSKFDNDGTEDVFEWDLTDVPAGLYYVYAVIDDGVNAPVYSYSTGAIIVNKLPSMRFENPRPGQTALVNQGDTYKITWFASDLDSQASIRLAYDDNMDPYDEDGIGTVLADGLVENDAYGFFDWDTTTTPAGIYYIVARIDDGVNEPIIVYSMGQVEITSKGLLSLTFVRPNDTDTRLVGDYFTIRWTNDGPDVDGASIALYMDTDLIRADGVLLDGSPEANRLWDGTPYTAANIPVDDEIGTTGVEKDSFEWVLRNVTPGTYYIYAVMTLGDQREVIYNCNPVTISKPAEFEFLTDCNTTDIVLSPADPPADVAYYAADADSNDYINFLLDTDRDMSNGVAAIVALNVPENDREDVVTLDPTKLPMGTFYLLAKMYDTDGVNPVLNTYYDFTITIQPSEVPRIEVLTPPFVDPSPVINGNFYDIVWAATDSDDNALVKLYYNTNNYDTATAMPIEGINLAPDGSILSATELYEDSGRQPDGSVPLAWRTWRWNISNIPAGEYWIMATIEDATQSALDFSNGSIIINKKPTITMLQPERDTTVKRGSKYSLVWTASDKDSDALISLYLDNNNDPASFGKEIATGIVETDGRGSYLLNTATIAEGTYYPVGLIDDGSNTFAYSYAPGRLIISNNPPPQILSFVRPNDQDIVGVVTAPTFEISWTDNGDDDAVIDLYYDSDGAGYDGTKITMTSIDMDTGPDSYVWDISLLDAGEYHIYAVATDGVSIARRYAPGPLTINKLPTFSFIQPDGKSDSVVRGRPYTISWTATDPDSQADIALYLAYDSINTVTPEDSNKRHLVDLIEGNGTDTYVLDTTNLAAKDYYPLARISDGVNPDIWVLSQNPITVLPNLAPTIDIITPATGTFLIKDATFPVSWVDGDDHNEGTIALFYDSNTTRDGNEQALPGSYLTEDGRTLDSSEIPLDDPENFFVWELENMPSGVWFVMAVVSDGVNADVVDYSTGAIRINRSPEFTWVQPDGLNDRVVQGHSYNFQWTLTDPDDDATANLYLDTNADLSDGGYTHIGGSFEESVNSLLFSPERQFLPGIYWPLARVEDDVNVTQWVYSQYALEIVRNVSPTLEILTPQSGEILVAGDSFYIRWLDADPDDNARLTLYYDTDNFGSNGVRINQTDILENEPEDYLLWDLSNVVPGKYFIYGILDDGFNPPLTVYSDGSILLQSLIGKQYELGLHALAETGTVYSITPSTVFPSAALVGDKAVAYKTTSDDLRAYMLLDDGTVRVYDATGEVDRISTGIANAVDLELDVDDETFHVMGVTGEFRSFGNMPALAAPYGFPLAEPRLVDFALNPNGKGAYVLEDTGVIHAASIAGTTETFTTWYGPPLQQTRSAVAIRVTNDGGYVLDKLGNLYTLGDATVFDRPVTATDLNPARDLLVLDEVGGLVLQANGEISSFGERIVPPVKVPVTTPIMQAIEWSKKVTEMDQADVLRRIIEIFAMNYRNRDINAIDDMLADDWSTTQYPRKSDILEAIQDVFDITLWTEWDIVGVPEVVFEDEDTATVTAYVSKNTFTWTSTSISGSPYIGPIVDRSPLSGQLRMSVNIDQTVRLEEYGDGRGISLFIDQRSSPFTGTWNYVDTYAFRDPGYETTTFRLNTGKIYKFSLINMGGSQIFDSVQGLTLSYYAGSGEPIEEIHEWTLRRVGLNDWVIIDMDLP